ncbi:helix-turn-helix domain-containing protein [Nocardiopsis sp. LDBS1602]|uniref:helix-turn-helix domain-containing protein n=1 Tax=Nocardiopsis sp. LDBS1602 TaxID=3109597 RepID=UPI002DBC09A1|nr:helix-turn-helix domain-containing protein [Nocardiopsis sp. LDBS1602]MEC3895978.1 helix-turn-helix domain-containing protein [Nocardiopsis sp. LDBS1602]
MDDLLTPAQAASQWGVSYATAARWAREGTIPALHVGRRYYYLQGTVDHVRRARSAGTTPYPNHYANAGVAMTMTWGAARSGTLLDREEWALTNAARTFDYLDYGKDSWSEDRHTAVKMAEASPALAGQMLVHRKAREGVVDAVCRSFSQVIDLGCGLPEMRRAPHERGRVLWGSRARTVYVDHDLAALAAARAWWEHPAQVRGYNVRVLDLDLRFPETLVNALGEHLDLSVPVGVLSTLTLDHLENSEVTGLVEVLAARLAPGSGWGLTHLSGMVGAAEVYTEQAQEQGADTRLVARDPEGLRKVFEAAGWGRWRGLSPREPGGGEPPIAALTTLARPDRASRTAAPDRSEYTASPVRPTPSTETG